jgi:predicted HicB family RNase H-like nuclease
MNIDPNAYNISIRCDNFDGERLFEARVKELPDLVEYSESYEDAYELAVDAIETAAKIFAEKGRAFPTAAVPADDFSGRVTLRLPRSLHRALAEAAESEGVSLNQYLVSVLSYFSGFAVESQRKDLSQWRTVLSEQETKKAATPPRLRLIHNDELQIANSDWN